MKHPMAFAALLEPLSKRFECFAIVRNPLATLASWNSLDWFALKEGHSPIGEKLDVDLGRALSIIGEVTDRQIHILEWFYDRFRRFLSEQAVIKYEDLMTSRGRELAKIVSAAEQLDEDLNSKNVSEFYDHKLMSEIGQRLLKRDGPIWNFYGRAAVEALVSETSRGAEL
ncbi:MAG: hypothetical protein DME57_06695 [Verrucomicrobia bacterium]|nr:MAG: hypothetical protein DME57_06695 [Verrucomicrobiota bacterium]